MLKHTLVAIAMLPLAATAAEKATGAKQVPQAPPGLSLRLSSPPQHGLTLNVDPRWKLYVVPPGSPGTPGLLAPLFTAPGAPSPPRPTARTLLFTPEDRAVTRTFHPLLTQDLKVIVTPAHPRSKP